MMLEHDGAMVSGRLQPTATDPGPDAVESVVAVRLLYTRGQGTGEIVGSGFFIEPWLQSVVTAAHVVCTPEGATPLQIEITLFSASGPRIVEASAFAYPATMSAVNDCAIVRLASPVVGLSSSAPPGTPPKGTFPATLYGYLGGELVVRNLNAHLANGLLQYDDPNASRPGMSGGPLRSQGTTVGIHVGLEGGQAKAAVPLGEHLLSMCMKAARDAEEGTT